MHAFLAFARRLAALQMAIAEVAMIAMMLAITADVLMRAAFNHPVRGTYDAVGILLALSAVFAFGHVILTRRDIVIDLIDAAVPARLSQGLKRLWSAVAVLLLGYVVWAMLQPLSEAYAYGDRSLELGLPMWTVWVLAVIGMAGAALAALAAAIGPDPDALPDPDTGTVPPAHAHVAETGE